MFMSWNGYPLYTRNSIIKNLKRNKTVNDNNNEPDNRKVIWIRLPYLGNIGDNMKKRCFRKVQNCLKEKVRFITCYQTKKIAMFCSAKDKIINDQKANAIYCITCPGCNEKYVGKTDRNIVTRLTEHGSRGRQVGR